MSQPTFTHEPIDGELVAVVRFPDGEMFTTHDWQGPQPQTAEDIPHYSWYQVDPGAPSDTGRWARAFVIDGWPRLLI